MYELINEPITVTATFAKNRNVHPHKFVWKNRTYTIDSVNFIHQSKEGADTLTHFAVVCGYETYKITFDSNSLAWTLDEICTNFSPDTFEVHDE